MKQILILGAYKFDWEIPEKSMTADGFIKALEDNGFKPGQDMNIEIFHRNTLSDHLAFLNERLARSDCSLDLIYASSSSLMEVARKALIQAKQTSIPLVYWGSHIIDQCSLVNAYPKEPFVAGVVLQMPLYVDHRQFRLLKDLFPNLETVHCPFSVQSAFCHPKMKKKYQQAVEDMGHACWFESRSPYGGFPGLGNLAEIIDVKFLEHPCAHADHLEQAVRRLPALDHYHRDKIRDIIISGIECFHIPGAVETLIRTADSHGIPYLGLNFTSFFPDHGPLAVFANNIPRAAYTVGTMAAQILQGALPAKIGIVHRDNYQFYFNESYAHKKEYILPDVAMDRIRQKFNTIISARPYGQ